MIRLYKNMKIGTKLISAFILVALVFAGIGAYTISNLNMISQSDASLYRDFTVPISKMTDISTTFQIIKTNTRNLVLASTDKDRQTVIEKMDTYRKDILKGLDALKASFSSSVYPSGNPRWL